MALGVAEHSKGPPSRIRLPTCITAKVLLQIKHHLSAVQLDVQTAVLSIACIVLLGFFLLWEILPENPRGYNLTTSCHGGDIAVDNHKEPRMVQIFLKRSKCDQFGVGAKVVLALRESSYSQSRPFCDMLRVGEVAQAPSSWTHPTTP